MHVAAQALYLHMVTGLLLLPVLRVLGDTADPLLPVLVPAQQPPLYRAYLGTCSSLVAFSVIVNSLRTFV